MEGTDSDGLSFLMHGASGAAHRHSHPGLSQATVHQRQQQERSTQKWQHLTPNQQQQPAPQQRQQFSQQQRQEDTQHPQQEGAQQQPAYVQAAAAEHLSPGYANTRARKVHEPLSPGYRNTQARQVHQPPSPGNTSAQAHPVRQPVRLQGIPKEKQSERGVGLLREVSEESNQDRRPIRLEGIFEDSKTEQGEDLLPPPRTANWHRSGTGTNFPPEGSNDTPGYSAERWRGASVNRAISQNPQAEELDDPMAVLLHRGKGMDPSLVVFTAAWSMVEEVLWKEQVKGIAARIVGKSFMFSNRSFCLPATRSLSIGLHVQKTSAFWG